MEGRKHHRIARAVFKCELNIDRRAVIEVKATKAIHTAIPGAWVGGGIAARGARDEVELHTIVEADAREAHFIRSARWSQPGEVVDR